jgi:hypothetical protein
MWNLLRMLLGKNPNDAVVCCPSCGHSDTFRRFGTWEEGGQRGLRGKLPSGHIVVACQKCRNELKYDSLSGKLQLFSA